MVVWLLHRCYQESWLLMRCLNLANTMLWNQWCLIVWYCLGRLLQLFEHWLELGGCDRETLGLCLVHWYLIISFQDDSDLAEHAGPLAEIQFWRSRNVDLSGIRDQLDDVGELLLRERLNFVNSYVVLMVYSPSLQLILYIYLHVMNIARSRMRRYPVSCSVKKDKETSSLMLKLCCQVVCDAAGVNQIVTVLEHAKSSYLPPFLSLRELILREAVVAQDNLTFLQCLESPCEKLSKAPPKVCAS